MKIRPVGAEISMRTDRHDKANSRFSQFCEKRLTECGQFQLFAQHDNRWCKTYTWNSTQDFHGKSIIQQ